MRWLYDIGIRLYWLAIVITSAWNRKARLWLNGRRGWQNRLRHAFNSKDQVIWFHCASLGEFEQGRPIMEAFREHLSGCRILLTFFSPSGYEKRKDYDGADHVMYLPLDTSRNVRKLLGCVTPMMAIFIKYEFWYHYLKGIQKRGIPLYLASGIFRRDQLFFRWYGIWYRKFLERFSHIFVQQQASKELLEQIGLKKVTVAGDTRFDRVMKAAESTYDHPLLREFTFGARVIIAGSTWEKDEQLLEDVFRKLPDDVRWIIAPHELSASHLQRLKKKLPESLCFSRLSQEIPPGIRVIIIDCIGLLSSLYRYGSIAYIGGGFGKGIHNILEPAAYGLPVIFGPNYQKFSEAVELIRLGAACPVQKSEELLSTFRQLLNNPSLLKTSSEIAKSFVQSRIGATSTILNKLFKKQSY